MNRWRLVDDPAGAGAENMARDEAILEAVQQGAAAPTLRFFMWSPPCLSLGAFQRATEVVDQAGCARLGVSLVRRPSGGRAILHDRELTYSVCAPAAALRAGDSVLAAYHRINQAVVVGLRSLGVEATQAPRRPGPVREAEHSAACFDLPADYEVLVRGRKLVGSAQVRRGPTVLQHGSLLLRFDAAALLLCLRLGPTQRRRWQYRMARGVTDLEREIGSADGAALRSALTAAFRGVFGASLEPCPLTAAEIARSRQLQVEKYAAASWTFRR